MYLRKCTINFNDKILQILEQSQRSDMLMDEKS